MGFCEVHIAPEPKRVIESLRGDLREKVKNALRDISSSEEVGVTLVIASDPKGRQEAQAKQSDLDVTRAQAGVQSVDSRFRRADRSVPNRPLGTAAPSGRPPLGQAVPQHQAADRRSDNRRGNDKKIWVDGNGPISLYLYKAG